MPSIFFNEGAFCKHLFIVFFFNIEMIAFLHLFPFFFLFLKQYIC